MLSAHKLRQRPCHFHRFIGLSVDEFDRLCQKVSEEYAIQDRQRKNRRTRRRALGGGRCFSLSLEDRMLATLLYLRLYISGALLSYLFNLDESNLCRERNERMIPVLKAVLPVPMQDHLLSAVENPDKEADKNADKNADNNADKKSKPKRRRISTLKELLEAHPEFEDIWADATEQEVPKPQDDTPQGKARKKHFYSGKSHCHTIKTQVVTSGRLVLHLFGGCAGSLHDRQLLRASGVMRNIPCLPPTEATEAGPPRRRKVRLDRGYCGAEKEWSTVEGVEVVIGIKGKRGQALDALERAWNAVLSRKRMQVEQTIGHLKNYRLLSGLYRGSRERHFELTRVIAGLHNFRLLPEGRW